MLTHVFEERYSSARQSIAISPSEKVEQRWLLKGSSGWYDIAVRSDDTNYLRRFAGHVALVELQNYLASSSDVICAASDHLGHC
jgi:hypothetical protein